MKNWRYVDVEKFRTAVGRRLCDEFKEKVLNYFAHVKLGAFEDTFSVVVRPNFTEAGSFDGFDVTLVAGDQKTGKAFGLSISGYVFLGDVNVFHQLHRAFQGLLWKAVSTEVGF